MTKQEMIDIMTPRGFGLYSHSGDGKVYHFIKGDIGCAVFDDGSFQFSLITNSMSTLSTGHASPVIRLDHFNRILNKFNRDAIKFINSDY